MEKCPCGKTPEKLIQIDVDCKWGLVCGDCCGEWIVEFRKQYETDPEKIAKLAEGAWNDAPRSR